ncbi:MarR family winged helix-turn-helix transcriptional regulator [Bradyrhizobium guangzhouense]|nr:MarR family winged helix-turn-helix transcriptional regulator [Bradyrhizobium guangzhouense]
MSKKLPFTEHSIRRLIRGIESAGKFVIGARFDGTLIIGDKPLDISTFAAPQRIAAVDGVEAGGAASWDDFEDAPASKWDDKRASGRDAPKRQDEQRQQTDPVSDPLVAAYDRFMRGEITFDQLPPGRYPNGMRIYAVGEWEAIVRSQPLNRLERAALEAYFERKGTISYERGAGPRTIERLEARGFVQVVQTREDGREPYYGITPAGEAEWLRLTGGAEHKGPAS